MNYQLPALPYAYDALEPHIDAKTMEIHHTKHHQTYINNLNKALEGHALGQLPVEQLMRDFEQIPANLRDAVRNNGGGHANHSLFWTVMTDNYQPLAPNGRLAAAIDADIGGMETFKEKFTQAAIARFGSGWAWLCVDKGRLTVEHTGNQDSPLMQQHIPILGLDVWEHAYYLKYQNRRPEYIAAFFNVVNWAEVERRFAEAV